MRFVGRHCIRPAPIGYRVYVMGWAAGLVFGRSGWGPLGVGGRPRRLISQYAHYAWRTQDGLFTESPTEMVQTADGYLWMGTRPDYCGSTACGSSRGAPRTAIGCPRPKSDAC